MGSGRREDRREGSGRTPTAVKLHNDLHDVQRRVFHRLYAERDLDALVARGA
jgi:hypothetical protein